MDQVKERPILFSSVMAKAIDLGLKTMTRRVVKPQPIHEDQPWPNVESHVTWEGMLSDPHYYLELGGFSPFGVVGDRLWVKENYRIVGWEQDYSRGLIEYKADDRRVWQSLPTDDVEKALKTFTLKAYIDKTLSKLDPKQDKERGFFVLNEEGYQGPWKSSMYMPRWASRSILAIDGIKAERLQDITINDLVLEGMRLLATPTNRPIVTPSDLLDAWRKLWNDLHPDRHTWEDNPWVFALSFSKLNS